ncbi:helix-turn-helix domain-containing protein [Cytophagales bacterium RKSG123]|nr:helix-turn-helix domain-containing protein [Xanthovirga aplysinae]
MPWKAMTTMDQKIEFICEWLGGKHIIIELCKAFEITRPTAYKVIRRYESMGIEGLREQSKAPRNHPNQRKSTTKDPFLKGKTS